MVAAETNFEIPEHDEISLVSLRKYANELDLLWYERWFLYFIYLPVVRFGFLKMHIASPSAIRPDGTVEFMEQVEAHLDEETAIEALRKNEPRLSRFSPSRYSVKQIPLDVKLPDASVQYKAPKSRTTLPDRYRRRSFAEPVSATQMRQVKRNMESVIKSAAVT